MAVRTYPARDIEVELLRRPITACEILPAGLAGLVRINGTEYALAYHSELPATGEPIVRGYRLTKDDGTAYDLPHDLRSCDCLDGMVRSRPGGCKHAAALRLLCLRGDLL